MTNELNAERYMIWNNKENPGEINFDFTLVIPEGWEMVCRNLHVDTDKRTITPRGDNFAFGLRRKRPHLKALTAALEAGVPV